MYSQETKRKIEAEFLNAEQSRANRLEGRARVCARRAAGVAIRDYLERIGLEAANPSANDLLHWLKDQPEMPETTRQAAEYLLMQVNPDFELPVIVDLILEARRLVDALETAPAPFQKS